MTAKGDYRDGCAHAPMGEVCRACTRETPEEAAWWARVLESAAAHARADRQQFAGARNDCGPDSRSIPEES